MSVLIELPLKEREVVFLADWMELNALLDSDGVASREDLISQLGIDDEIEDDQIENSPSDNVADDVFAELQRRVEATLVGYPFLVNSTTIRKKKNNGKKSIPYIFCLLVSYFGPEKENINSVWKLNLTAKKFEELSNDAALALFHNENVKARSVIFGYPRRWEGKVGNPQFVKALKKICLDSGEMAYIKRAIGSDAKDAGLDIVLWKKFPDNLQGGLFFWGQCAIGKNWTSKLSDLDRFNYFVQDITPISKGLFIPHLTDNSSTKGFETWQQMIVSSRVGIIFNRSRIAFLTARSWKDDWTIKFCRDSIGSIRNSSEKNFTEILSA